MVSRTGLGRGSYTLNNYRFPLDPKEPVDGGRHFELSQKKTQTIDGIAFQTWPPSYGDKEQEFTWDIMDDNFYNALLSTYEEHLSDPTITHKLIFHKLSDETWNVIINSFSGKSMAGNIWRGVRLAFTLLDKIEEV